MTRVPSLLPAGAPWSSILVETGVYKPAAGQTNDLIDPATHVCKDVAAAVSVIIAATVT